jgi:hypothetical protein
MTRFDLTKLGQDYQVQVARMRFFAGVFLVIALAVAAYLAVRFELYDAWTRFNLEGLVGLLIIAGGIGTVTWILSPGALAVEVDALSVRFEYPGGRTRALAWNDRRFRLVIDHTTGTRDSLSHGKAAQLAMDRRAFQDFLTPAAFRAILTEADRQGLNVTERLSPRAGWRRSTIASTRS